MASYLLRLPKANEELSERLLREYVKELVDDEWPSSPMEPSRVRVSEHLEKVAKPEA